MQGIEILNTILPEKPINIFMASFYCVLTLFWLFFIFAEIGSEGKGSNRNFLLSIILAVSIGIMFGITITTIKNRNLNPEQYEALIDNKIDFNEFYNKYEIINQRGKIYTIQEKNKNAESISN